MYNEEVTTTKKYNNWNVWRDGKKKNMFSILPMTTEQALKHFKADAVQGLEEEFVDHFGQHVNEVEGRVS